MKNRNQSGFSLIELVIVLSLITLFVGVSLPSFNGFLNSERAHASEDEMSNIREAVNRYAQDTGILPINLDRLYQDNKTAGWGGPYIADLNGGRDVAGSGFRNDEWGRSYTWIKNDSITAELRSNGANGKWQNGQGDDIVHLVDITPVLRELSKARRDRINSAITSYNAINLPGSPLSTNSNTLINTLQSGSYLPIGNEWKKDAFSDSWVTVGVPVTHVKSPNFGT